MIGIPYRPKERGILFTSVFFKKYIFDILSYSICAETIIGKETAVLPGVVEVLLVIVGDTPGMNTNDCKQYEAGK